MSLVDPNMVERYNEAIDSNDTEKLKGVTRRLYQQLLEFDERIEGIVSGNITIYGGGGGAGGGGGGTGGTVPNAADITVAVADWTPAVDPHPDYPGDYFYADLFHDLKNERARVDHWIDSYGFMWTNVDLQQPLPADPTRTLRIWLENKPLNDTEFHITALL